jgi:D-serine deaminase-like pyridoxal phosphate-dependent protein
MTAGPSPADVETPVGYVDLARARANAWRVTEYARQHGLEWRPHIKTHKSTVVARIQLDAGARGLTVATPREAEVMASVSLDLLLAYPPVGGSKLERLGALDPSVDLKVALDSTLVLEALAHSGRVAGRTFGVLVEADVGLGRVGVQTPEDVVEIAREAAGREGVTFRGLLFYPGHIRMEETRQAEPIAAVADRLSRILDALHTAGLPPEIVSGGSTPTLWSSHKMPGMTEVRSGSCIFFDREALEVGVAQRDHLAYTVLATVVSTAVPGRAVVDAGSKALAKEGRGGDGFGFVLDRPEVLVSGLSEEHGVLDVTRTDWRPVVGERVRIVPNHVCVSVNLQDALLARDGDAHRVLELEGRGRGPWTA